MLRALIVQEGLCLLSAVQRQNKRIVSAAASSNPTLSLKLAWYFEFCSRFHDMDDAKLLPLNKQAFVHNAALIALRLCSLAAACQ